MKSDRIEPKSWTRSPWFIWSWLLVLAVVVLQSLTFHWRLLPTTASGYFTRGRADYYDGDYEEAIKNLSKSIEGNPNDAESRIWRGEAYAKLHEFDKAKPDLLKALELAPDYPKSHAALGDYHAAVWDADAAIKEFTVAIDRDPTYARCYFERGQLYFDAERWAEAAADLRKGAALLADDQQVEAYLLLWLAGTRNNDAVAATTELLDVVKSRSVKVRWFWTAAEFLHSETDESEFLAEMAKSTRADGGDLKAEASFLAGEKRLVFGDRVRGLASLREVLRSEAEESFAYGRARAELTRSYLGFAPMRLDDDSLAIASLTPGGPAELAGIKPGARLAAIDQEPADRDTFLALLARLSPGTTVQLAIVEADGSRRVVPLAVPLTPETSAPTK